MFECQFAIGTFNVFVIGSPTDAQHFVVTAHGRVLQCVHTLGPSHSSSYRRLVVDDILLPPAIAHKCVCSNDGDERKRSREQASAITARTDALNKHTSRTHFDTPLIPTTTSHEI
jgi:hypothetical protein